MISIKHLTFKEIAVANEFPFFLTFMFLQSVPNCRHHFPATFYLYLTAFSYVSMIKSADSLHTLSPAGEGST